MRENKPLTAIRGWAAIIVVFYHVDLFYYKDGGVLHNIIKNGYVFVDVFFVLSGFILTMVYWNLKRADVGTFFARRFFRIYPLHFSVMLFIASVVAAAQLFHVSLNSGFPWRVYPAVLLLVQPFIYDHVVGWNTPSWSIGVEFACYALFPFVIWALQQIEPRWRLVILIAFGGLEAVYLHAQLQELTAGYGAMLRGLFGFLLGASLSAWLQDVDCLSIEVASITECLCVAGLVMCVLAGSLWGIVLLSAILIGVLSYDAGIIAQYLRSPTCLWLGQISFSVYLVHFPVLMILGKFIAPWRLPFPRHTADILFIGTSMAVVLLCSAITYRYIEMPARRWGANYCMSRQPE